MDAEETKIAAKMEAALDSVLTALRRHIDAQPKSPPKLVDAADIDVDELLLGRGASIADELAEDPVGRSLRFMVSWLGEQLHELGGMEAMHQAAHRIAAKGGREESWRTNVIDKRWDGIGLWAA